MLQRIARTAAVALVVLAAACEPDRPTAPHGLDEMWIAPVRTYEGDDPSQPRVVKESLALTWLGTYQRKTEGFGAFGRPVTERTSMRLEDGDYQVAGNELRFMPSGAYTQIWDPAEIRTEGGRLAGTYVALIKRGRTDLQLTYLDPATGAAVEAVTYHPKGLGD